MPKVLLGGIALTALVAGLTVGSNPPRAQADEPPYHVVFDNSHSETAGNADWVISTSQPDPLGENASPSSETDWTGGLSAWGVALQQTGNYTLSTIPESGSITTSELSDADVLVLPEPNNLLSDSEKSAVLSFVEGSGGLFMIGDHDNSDRDGDGVDSVDVLNDLMAGDPFGITVDVANIGDDDPDGIGAQASDGIIHGSFGDVTGTIIRSGTTATIDPAANASARGEVYLSDADPTGTTGIAFASSGYGSGRVTFWGDSSPADDGTGDPEDTLYDGWNDPAGTNAALALNATEWLAGGSGSGGDPTDPPEGGELLTDGGFEGGGSAWQQSSQTGNDLVVESPVHGGGRAASLCGDNQCMDELTQTVEIPSDATSAWLSYWTRVDTEETTHAYDFLEVEIRTGSGDATVQSLDDGSQAGMWVHGGADLSAYLGQTVTIAFVASNGDKLPTAFGVDAVSIVAN